MSARASSWTRTSFAALGGFEDWLPAGAGKPLAEDTWFGWRVRRSGARTAFEPAARVDHAVFRRGMGDFVAERLRLRHFPAIVERMPELRGTLAYRRWFLNRRSAELDLAVAGASVALLAGRRWALVACVPYGTTLARSAARWGREAAAGCGRRARRRPRRPLRPRLGQRPPPEPSPLARMPARVLAIGNMYPPHHLGGYELMWQGAMGALRRRGCDVRVLASDYRAPEGAGSRRGRPRGPSRAALVLARPPLPRLSPRAVVELERANQETLARHLREWRPDVVSWWAMGGMSLGLIEAVRRSGTPAVGAVIDDWMVYGPKVDAWQRACSRLGPLRGTAERLARVPAAVDLDAAGRWLFVSEAARAGARRTGLKLPESAVVHGGVDHGLFTPAAEREWEWRLLYVGRIDERKGLTVAVRALAELPQARLTIAGDGDRRHLAELRALAAREGVLDRIAFERRARPELPSMYAASDALLFPVLWEEPWGIVPLEAMAVGRPVVATGTGGSAEYLSDGENCLVYRPRDEPAGLAAAVSRLAEDAALRDRLRQGGLTTAARFTEDAFDEAVADATLAACAA